MSPWFGFVDARMWLCYVNALAPGRLIQLIFDLTRIIWKNKICVDHYSDFERQDDMNQN